MTITEKKIAIIGGGPGGLTLARLLQQSGGQVTVYERDVSKNARVQGANLDLHKGSGLAALQKANLLEAFYANHLPHAGLLRLMDHRGQIYFDDHLGDHQQGQLSDHRPEIDRGPLRKILLDSLLPHTVEWDHAFNSMKPEKDGWRLLFKNGKESYADIVIGADGANSKVRPYLTDIRPRYSGVTIVEGNIPNAERNVPKVFASLRGGKIFAFGNEQSIILSTKGDGSLAFYTGEKVSPNWVTESGIDFRNIYDVKKWFRNHFSQWDKLFHELFETDHVTVIPRPMFHYETSQAWTTQHNLTILGDAAHRMPPYAGEGVNMAMLDALELSDALLSEEPLPLALKDYKARMLARAAEVTTLTLQNTAAMHQPDALTQLLEMFQSFES